MKLPVWTKPALSGAAVGAVALAIVGFSWGGWTTQGAAQDLARKEAVAAIAAALTPYCIERSKADPNSIQLIAELKAASSFNRRGIVEKAGWATPLGAEKPDRELAQACQLALSASL
jgi:pimeloyl-ACP methyl ester carboxylesterase